MYIFDPRNTRGPSYDFTYNTDSVPHLTSIQPTVYLQGEGWQFTYATTTLTDPFAGASYGPTALLASAQQTPITTGSPAASGFAYSNAAEMTQYTTPMGGTLSWVYQPFTCSGGVTVREVTSRSMNDAAASLTNSWPSAIPRRIAA